MAEIQHWMRRSCGNTDANSPSAGNTPQKRPKKKLSAYLPHRTGKPSNDDLEKELWAGNIISSGIDQPQNISSMLSTIFEQLCREPFNGLPPQMNSSLFAIIEAYRGMSYEVSRLEENMQAMVLQLEQLHKEHSIEKASFKNEIKRLELVIAKGKGGMAKLMATRQDSVIRRKPKKSEIANKSVPNAHDETPTSILEASRVSTTAITSKTTAMSKGQFLSDFHRYPPVSAPTSKGASHTFQRVSNDSDAKSGLSATSYVTSTFSSSGDQFPSEIEKDPGAIFKKADGAGEELEAIKKIASIVAARRGLRIEIVLPKIISLFVLPHEPETQQTSSPKSLDVEAKARGFSTLYHQQLGTNTPHRPFSFVPGDDTTTRSFGADDLLNTCTPIVATPTTSSTITNQARRVLSSDLSISGYENPIVAGPSPRPTSIPSPTWMNGLAQSRQGCSLSSSGSSRRTAKGYSLDQVDPTRRPGAAMNAASRSTSGASLASVREARSPPEDPATPERSDLGPGHEAPIKQKSNEVRAAAVGAATEAVRASNGGRHKG